jgi:PAS domain S-box-containing protein
MNISWTPVVLVDVAGSILTLFIALGCANNSWLWLSRKTNDIFRQYVFLVTIAFVIFAVSRSFGHLLKQLLLFNDLGMVWKNISPYSGAVNSVTFVVIFSFCIYFNRLKGVHVQIERYRTSLEELVAERTRQLEESNLTLDTILNSANPICMVSLDFEMLIANTAYYKLWPKRAARGEVLKCFESRPGPSCGTDSCPINQISKGRNEVVGQFVKELPDRQGHFIVTARPFEGVDGKTAGVVESFQDITEQVKVTDELIAERERLSVTLRSIGDGVLATDTRGDIILLNSAAEQITGWSQAEAIGQPFEEVFNIKDKYDPDATVHDMMTETFSSSYETLMEPKTLLTKAGEEILVSEHGAPVRDSKSQVVGAVLVFRDVTESSRMEDEMAKIQKLESVGVLAGGIAHDFNNLLTAILGNINLALDKTEKGDEVYELLTESEKASVRAQSLTSQLLTFSKGGEPVRKLSTVPEMIRDSAGFVLRGSNIQCNYNFDDDLWAAEIDSDQISQVIQNLVLNAGDAMPAGGTIDIDCVNYDNVDRSDFLKIGKYLKIAITDHGKGIPAENIEKIFDPFFSTKEQGSGLGLATTHAIVNNHDGHIEVESEEGRGTTFTIYLPATEKDFRDKDEKVQTDHPVTAGGGRLMIMDDEEMIRVMVGKMLGRLGFETVSAADGEEAIRLYQEAIDQEDPIRGVIMDLTIPGGMGGKEAVIEILKIDPGAKVIVSSG